MRPDHLQATSKTLGKIAGEPMTWLPFAPVAAAYAFVGAPWWLCVPVAGVIGTGVVAWWKKRWNYLFNASRVENLRAWLEQENAILDAAFRSSAARLDWKYLTSLSRSAAEPVTIHSILAALDQKRLIEDKILSDGILTTDEEELSRVISRLMSEVRAEIDRLAALSMERQTAATEAIASIATACQTLREAATAAEQLIDPLAGVADVQIGAPTRAIDRSTEQLRERMQQAAAIKRRVAESLREPDGSGAPPAERLTERE